MEKSNVIEFRKPNRSPGQTEAILLSRTNEEFLIALRKLAIKWELDQRHIDKINRVISAQESLTSYLEAI